jgi:hypothetical protein
MTTRMLVRLAVSVACLLPAACATTSYSRSGVAAVPAGVKGSRGSNASLQVEGLKLRIESLDYAKKGDALPPFAVRLVFDPSELGYSFDPSQVALRAPDGSTWQPRVHGPGQFKAPSWTCSGTGFTSAEARGYHLLAPRTCFELSFDVALSADTRLELELAGFARGRKRLEPVRLALTRRSGRSIDRVYWLEVLLAPLAMYGGG